MGPQRHLASCGLHQGSHNPLENPEWKNCQLGCRAQEMLALSWYSFFPLFLPSQSQATGCYGWITPHRHLSKSSFGISITHTHMMCTTNFHSVTRWAQGYDEDYLTSQHLQAHLTSTSVKSMFLAATSKWKYVIFAVSMFGFPYPLNILSFCCILDAKKKKMTRFLTFLSLNNLLLLRKSHGESMSCDQGWCRSKRRADSFRMLS